MVLITISKIEGRLYKMTFVIFIKTKERIDEWGGINIEMTLISVTETNDNLNERTFFIFSETQKWLDK